MSGTWPEAITARKMVMLVDQLTAQQALEMGMVTRVVAADKLDETVDAVLKNWSLRAQAA
ncbi:MAG: hypothetical protein FJZ85_01740 [Chloroflexi bacterium]|nr:hypothetical protein [Chloroflexota bacterium]MBM3174303.1 hypothetical protein [Chloroflexota bacterium]